MMHDYFVMLQTQQGGMTPMEDDNGELATFMTSEEAAVAAKNSVLGNAFGYEVFERGFGCVA